MTTAMSPPVNLPVPTPWPKPSPGCGVCAALARQRAEAAAIGDYSRVSDYNVEIRNHTSPHGRSRP
ncbi:hypothetical protein K8369_09650 [Streptomyces sp. PSKA30]|nr:hypothetical protein [Streptomyces sp. PSKA30]